MSIVEHKTVEESYQSHQTSLRKAIPSGHWMGAVWRVKDGKLEFLGKTTWNFPVADFDAAIQQLQFDCDAEKKRLVEPDPGEILPMADFLQAGNSEGESELAESEAPASPKEQEEL